MAVTGERALGALGFETGGISLKSSMAQVAAFASVLRDAADAAFAGLTKIAAGEAEAAARAEALGVSVDTFAEWKFIAEQTGASAEALEASLKAMLANNPGLADAASELERAGGAMRDMGDAGREAYALELGIDPSLIPMLTQDVSGLRDMFRSLYATAGTDARQAAEDSEGFLNGVARLAGLCDLLAKAVGLSLMGTARDAVEGLNAAFAAHFDDIRRVLEVVIALVSAAGPVIGAVIGQLAFWGGQLAGLLGMLDADLAAGIGKGIAAFMALRGAVGAAIVGFANLREAWGIVTAALSANPYLFAIGALVTLAVLVVENWDRVKACFLGMSGAVASAVRAAVDGVAGAVGGGLDAVLSAGSSIAGAVGAFFSTAMDVAGAAVSGAAEGVSSALGGALELASGLLPGLTAAAGAMLRGIVDGLLLVRDLVAAVFSGDLPGALDAALGLFANFRGTLLGIFSGLAEAILGVFSSLWGKVTGAFPDFGAWAEGVAGSAVSALGSIAGPVGSAVSGVLDAVGAAVSGSADALAPLASGALEAVGPVASDAAESLSSALAGAVGFVSARFPELGAAAEAVGQGLIREFRGIRDFVVSVFAGDFSGALDAALGLFSGFRETAFGIFSALGAAILGVFAFLWGQVAAAFPDFGAWAAGAASAITGAFGKALGWVREKLDGLMGMLPGWALEQLGWKAPGTDAGDGDMPGFGIPYAHDGPGVAGYGGSGGPAGYGFPGADSAAGGSFRGVPPEGGWGAGPSGGVLPGGVPGAGGSGGGASGAYPSGTYPSGAYPSGGHPSGAAGPSGISGAGRRASGGGSPRSGIFGADFRMQPFFPPSTDAYLTAAPWQSAAMAGGRQAVSLEARTEINVSGAGSPQEVARRVAAEQDNLNADLIRYAQGAAR